MNRIISIDRSTRLLTLGAANACKSVLANPATLTVWLAGCWPKHVLECKTVETECGCTRVTTYKDVWPDRLTYTAMRVDPNGDAVFLLDDAWLQARDGRYDGTFTTPCGTLPVRFHKRTHLEMGAIVAPTGGDCTPTECGTCPTPTC